MNKYTDRLNEASSRAITISDGGCQNVKAKQVLHNLIEILKEMSDDLHYLTHREHDHNQDRY